MFISVGLLYLFALLPKFIEEKFLMRIVIAWLIVSVFLDLVLGIFELTAIFISVLLLKTILMYFWLWLLYFFEDTIFTYLVILALGGIFLGVL